MQSPHIAVLDILTGQRHRLRPGDIIGRAITAALQLDDPRVSEAHAMVSLRGEQMYLLALRGQISIDGVPEDEVRLHPAQELYLAEDVALRVEQVILPDKILALRLGQQPLRPLRAPIYSVLTALEEPEMVPQFVADAAARMWSTTDGWTLQIADRPPEILRANRSWDLGGVELASAQLPLSELSQRSTSMGSSRYEKLQLVVRYTSVHILRENRAPAILTGLPAQLLTELAVMGCPAYWQVVAEQLWRDGAPPRRLRRRWDRTLERLRAALAESGIRDDLVRADNQGNYEAFLLPSDEMLDES
ncbi:MAG: hypothetical protein ACI8S6_004890 [Myxococcota bacterium]|jgi:hypothetical protein